MATDSLSTLVDHLGEFVHVEGYGKLLRDAILELATRGALTDQNPADEPSSLLLERVRDEKLNNPGGRSARVRSVNWTRPAAELPDGWEWASMADLTTKIGSGSTPRGGRAVYVADGPLFLRSQNVWNDGLRIADAAHITSAVHAKMSTTSVRADDVLLNITGASIGRSAIVPAGLGDANVSQHVMILRPALPELAPFLHLYVMSPTFQSLIDDAQVGISREGLSKQSVEKMSVPVPPLAEQSRIAYAVVRALALLAQLEEAAAEAETIRSKLVETALRELAKGGNPLAVEHLADLVRKPRDVDALASAYLALAAGGHLTRPGGYGVSDTGRFRKLPLTGVLGAHPDWERKPLGDLTTILNGYAFDSANFSESSGLPLVRIRDIFNTKTQVMYAGEYDSKYVLQTGDILVGMDGNFNVASWSGSAALLNQRVCKITVDENQLSRRFLLYLLPGYLQAIHDETPSTTVTHLSSRSIESIPFPVPPIDEQHSIVSKLDQMELLTNNVRHLLTSI